MQASRVAPIFLLLPLVAEDLTRGAPRYGLGIRIFGLAAFCDAAVSTSAAGWLAMPETRAE